MREALLLLMILPWLCVSGLTASEKSFRRQDDRMRVDLDEAAKNGIQRYTSQYLILYTDIEPEKAREIVGLVDQVYPAWEEWLGQLPPARDQSPFQITGFLMRNPDRFQQSNLLRIRLNQIQHGQSDGYAFWMHDQESDYYRAHLLLHEATHCFSTCQESEGRLRPLWFIEGIAEYFGTHEQGHESAVRPAMRFGIIPASEDSSLGFGRIEMIRKECLEGRALSAEQVLQLSDVFSESRTTPYAWSWAFCTFLASHPDTAEEFRTVCHQVQGNRFERFFGNLSKKHPAVLSADWELYRDSLCYGFDLAIGGTKRTPTVPLEKGQTREVSVQARGGWQSTGVTLTAGQTVQLTATGRVTLAETTGPWISEPNGISIRYSEGKPIGRLQAAIERTTPDLERSTKHWEFHDVGTGTSWTAPEAGVLYLRVNDRWNELADNSGEYQVSVTARD